MAKPVKPTLAVAVVLVMAIIGFIISSEPYRRLYEKRMKPHELGLIHVGKCGGTALKQALMMKRNPTRIQQRRPEWFHMDYPSAYKYNEWIAVIRDPIERIKSNYLYEHPNNAPLRKDKTALQETSYHGKHMVYRCFETLEDLAEKAYDGNHPETTCQVLAERLFGGIKYHIPGLPHAGFNYDAYFSELLRRQDITIWVIRHEHMLNDINTIDRAMGGRGLSFLHHYSHLTNEHGAPVQSRFVSEAGLQNLCKMLCTEIQVYKNIYRRAKNLDIAFDLFFDKSSTVAHHCHEQIAQNHCPPVNYYSKKKK